MSSDSSQSMLKRMQELLVHHYNLSGALSREAAARGYGIDPEPYKHPYPGSTNNTFLVNMPGEANAEAILTADLGNPKNPPSPPTTVSVSGGFSPIPLPPSSTKPWWQSLLAGLAVGALPAIVLAGIALFWPKGKEVEVQPIELEAKWRKLEDGSLVPVGVKEVPFTSKPK